MKNFFLLAENIDVKAALEEVLSQQHLFGQRPHRQKYHVPLAAGVDIWLRWPSSNTDSRENSWVEPSDLLPECKALIFEVMHAVKATRIGRCFVSKLAPGGKILPHSDIGPDPTQHYDTEPYWRRHHIVLQGNSKFYCEDEVVTMKSGELWVFANWLEHWVHNDGEQDRIHLFADLRSS